MNDEISIRLGSDPRVRRASALANTGTDADISQLVRAAVLFAESATERDVEVYVREIYRPGLTT
jgi:hypothetical protein